MSDLHALLPNFPSAKYASLLAGLETHRVTLSELLTLDAAEVGKRTRLPLLGLQRLCEEVRAQLLSQTAKKRKSVTDLATKETDSEESVGERKTGSERQAEAGPVPQLGRISTLDPALDVALAGGFPTGVLSEVVGESGVGKTQLLLSLLIAVQLPPPRGLGRKALYIASEAPLATSRLTQIIRNHPDEATLRQYCSLQSIATINVPDLEAQEHILTHQLPVQLAKAEQYGGPSGSFGLVVLDSVAANFRPFFGGGGMDRGGLGGLGGRPATGGKGGGGGGGAGGAGGGDGRSNSLAARSLELQRLGMLLRTLAQKHNLAVVVANQVADRFDEGDLDGGGGGGDSGGLVSLSQQWGAGAGAAGYNTGTPRRISSMASVPAKKPRQGGGAMLLAQPPPLPSHEHHHPQNHPIHIPLSQESPLAARSRRQQPDASTPTTTTVAVATLPTSSQVDTDTDRSLPTTQDTKFQPPAAPIEEPPPSADDFMPPFASSQYIPPSQFPPPPPAPPVLQLDHQQRWFTGWGDGPDGGIGRNKTPALGLVWATQLGMRVALVKASRLGGSGGGRYPSDSNYYPDPNDEEYDENSVAERHNMGAPRLRHSWRRWMKVVFAPHVPATGARSISTAPPKYKSALAARMQGAVEFEITMGGLRGVEADSKG